MADDKWSGQGGAMDAYRQMKRPPGDERVLSPRMTDRGPGWINRSHVTPQGVPYNILTYQDNGATIHQVDYAGEHPSGSRDSSAFLESDGWDLGRVRHWVDKAEPAFLPENSRDVTPEGSIPLDEPRFKNQRAAMKKVKRKKTVPMGKTARGMEERGLR